MEDEGKGFLVLDTISIPMRQTVHDIVEYANKTKVIIWDSSNGGEMPYILGSIDKELTIKDINETKQ